MFVNEKNNPPEIIINFSRFVST